MTEKEGAQLMVTGQGDGMITLEVIGHGTVEMAWMGALELSALLHAAAAVSAKGLGVDWDTWNRVVAEAAEAARAGLPDDEEA